MSQRSNALIALLYFSLIGSIGFSKPENEDDYHIYKGGRIVFHNGAVVEGTVEYGGMHPDTIIDFDSAEFDTLRKKVKKLIKAGLRPREVIRSIITYVQTKMFPWSESARSRYHALNQEFIANKQDIPLSKYVSQHAGDCREASIVIQMALGLAGIPSFYVYTSVQTQTTSKSGSKREESLDHAFLVIYAAENRLTLPGFGDAWVVDSLMPGLNGYKLSDLQKGLNDQSDVANFFDSFSKTSFNSISSYGPRKIVQFYAFPKVWIPKSAGVDTPFSRSGELLRSYAKRQADHEDFENDLKSLVQSLKNATPDSWRSDDFMSKRTRLNLMLRVHFSQVFERLESKLVQYLSKISPAPMAALEPSDLFAKAGSFLKILMIAELKELKLSHSLPDLQATTHALLMQWYYEQLENLEAWCSAVAHPTALLLKSVLESAAKVESRADTRVRSLLRTSPKKIRTKLDLTSNMIKHPPTMIGPSAAAAAVEPRHNEEDLPSIADLNAAFYEAFRDRTPDLPLDGSSFFSPVPPAISSRDHKQLEEDDGPPSEEKEQDARASL